MKMTIMSFFYLPFRSSWSLAMTASMARMTEETKALFSRAISPATVVPPGEQTLSIKSQGVSSVSITIRALP